MYNSIKIAAVSVCAVIVLTGSSTLSEASSPKLSGELLSVGQMPVGWSVDNSSSGSGIGCLSNLLEPKGLKQIAHASVAFDDNGGTPLVDEKIAAYSNSKTAYKRIVATLMSCKHVSGSSGGVKASGTVGQMNFTNYGDASTAFSVNLQIQGTTLDGDLLIIRKGAILMGIEQVDYPPIDINQFQSFIVKALHRI